MASIDLNTLYECADDRDLLNATLAECKKLLWDLEHLVKDPERQENPAITNKIDLVKTQILLYERLMIGEKIDSLVVLMNHYAQKAGQPGVEIMGARAA